MTFGEKLKLLRNSKHYTQEQLCKLLNIERSSYSNYELGKRFPDPQILIRISDFYQISLDLLLRDHYEQTPLFHYPESEELLRNYYTLDLQTRHFISDYIAFCAHHKR